MCPLQNSAGSIGYGETPGEDGYLATSIAGKERRDLINQANSVPLYKIFSHYGLNLNANNIKIICPFKHHKGGRENTASFQYYHHTNSFYCHGCKVGGNPCIFVANLNGCNISKAAVKILELFKAGDYSNNLDIFDREEFSEKLEIMMDFSGAVRNFIHVNNDKKSRDFIEYICSIYDNLSLIHNKNFNNDAHRTLVLGLKEKIENYNEHYIW